MTLALLFCTYTLGQEYALEKGSPSHASCCIGPTRMRVPICPGWNAQRVGSESHSH